MKVSTTCQECNREATIEYDEEDGTLVFCTFCGEEYGEDGEVQESLPGVEWEENDGYHL